MVIYYGLILIVCHCKCRSLRRHGQSSDKGNRGTILAPLVGIILSLMDASVEMECGGKNDLVDVFASMECPSIMHCGFQYLLEYNWVSFFFDFIYFHVLAHA